MAGPDAGGGMFVLIPGPRVVVTGVGREEDELSRFTEVAVTEVGGPVADITGVKTGWLGTAVICGSGGCPAMTDWGMAWGVTRVLTKEVPAGATAGMLVCDEKRQENGTNFILL